MGLFFVGAIGFVISLVLLIVRKKSRKTFGILTALFLVVGLIGMISAMNTPAIDPSETVIPMDVFDDIETATSAKNDSKIETVITSGEVFDSIYQVWEDFNLVEVYDESVGTTLAKIDIFVNENTPLNNVRKYLDIVLDMRVDCAKEFFKKDYNDIVVHFKVKDFDGNLFFYLGLKPKGGRYVIDDSMAPEIVKLSDEVYRKAIITALDEL